MRTNPTKIDFATVVFREEIGLLRVQARSLARYMPNDQVGRILLVPNDLDEVDCIGELEALASDYGQHASKVEIVRPDDIFEWPSGLSRLRFRLSNQLRGLRGRAAGGWQGRPGWFVQQALKLAVARRVTSSHVVLMDAKNHLIAPCQFETFVSQDGRSRAATLLQDDYHFAWVKAAHEFFGVQCPEQSSAVLPTTTPFVVNTSVLEGTLARTEKLGGAVQLLMRPRTQPFTEFTLIGAYCTAEFGGWESVFWSGLPSANTIFRRASRHQIDTAIENARRGRSVFFGVHRTAIGQLSKNDLQQIRAIWQSHGLIKKDEHVGDVLGSKDFA